MGRKSKDNFDDTGGSPRGDTFDPHHSEEPTSPVEVPRVGFDSKYGALRVQKVRNRRGTDAGSRDKANATASSAEEVDPKVKMIKAVREGVEGSLDKLKN